MPDDIIKRVKTKGVHEIVVGNHNLLLSKKDVPKRRIKVTTSNAIAPRWVWIPVEYLEEVKASRNTTHEYKKWGDWKKKTGKVSLDVYGIGKQYAVGYEVSFVHRSSRIQSGAILYIEPFFDEPKFKEGFYLATLEEPKIISAYFANYKDEYEYPNESGKSDVHTYKGTMRLYILSHLIPDYTIGYHNFALFEIDIYDTATDKKVTDEPIKYYQKMNRGTFTVNTLSEIEFEIDEKWRDNSNHESAKKLSKAFYAKIVTIIYSNKDAVTSQETIDNIDKEKILSYSAGGDNTLFARRDKFVGLAPNHEQVAIKVNKEDVEKDWFGWFVDKDATKSNAAAYEKRKLHEYDTMKGEVLENQKVYFEVRYDLMDVILEKYEMSKNNMMVVTGDVAYSKKNNQPCKFSQIKVKATGMKPLILFDEEEKVSKDLVDKTDVFIGIVAGSEKKEVTITALGLATEFYNSKHVHCFGITKKIKIKKGAIWAKSVKHKNDDAFKHDSIEKVFNMEQAYMLFPDRANNPEAPASNTTGDESVLIDGQHLEYEYGSDNVTLKLGYIYNKNYNDRVLNFLAHKTDSLQGYDNLKNAWVINYLIKFIRGEKLYQSYFVPVATCRYPNQTVQLAVYPDMKWVLNFNYNIKTPLYYKASTPLETYYSQFNDGEYAATSNDNRRKGILNSEVENELQNYVGRKTDFGLYVACEIDGGEKIKVSKNFAEKFRSMLSPLLWIINKLDSDIGVSKAKAEQKRLKKLLLKAY